MSPARINRLLRRHRRRFGSLAVVAALALAIGAHHVPAAEHDHMVAAEVVALCMAVLPFVMAAVAVAVGSWAARRRAVAFPWAPFLTLTRLPAPRARSSPVATVVLRC